MIRLLLLSKSQFTSHRPLIFFGKEILLNFALGFGQVFFNTLQALGNKF